MLVAQALGEYGALSSMVSAASALVSRVSDAVRDVPTAGWIALVVAMLLLWVLFFRRV